MASKGRPYRTIVFEGFEILIGRGSEDNDHLTFDIAQPHDVWLHVGGGTLHAEQIEPNMYAAIDILVDKLDRQVKKHKEKLTDHHAKEVARYR